jgi:hypothetical protein
MRLPTNIRVAVYYARAMLHINVEDVLPQLRKAHQQNQPATKNQIKSTVKLQPILQSIAILSNQPFGSNARLQIEIQ